MVELEGLERYEDTREGDEGLDSDIRYCQYRAILYCFLFVLKTFKT